MSKYYIDKNGILTHTIFEDTFSWEGFGDLVIALAMELLKLKGEKLMPI